MNHFMRCLSCSAEFEGRYCPACGEKVLTAKDKSVLALLGELFENLFEINGKFPRTLWSLLFKPGLLPDEYMAGRRKSYLPPVSLLLAGIFVFFLAPTLTGLNTPLALLMERQSWSGLVTSLVENHLEQSGESFADFELRYNRLTENLSSLLLFLLVPMFSVPLLLLFWTSKRRYVEHLVFSLSYVSFLIWGILLLLAYLTYFVLVFINRYLTAISIGGDAVISSTIVLCSVAYLYLASNRFYGGNKLGNLVKVALFSVSTVYLIIVYRFILFLVTFYSLS